MISNLAGRVAVVTGAGGRGPLETIPFAAQGAQFGTGREIARCLAADGATVVAADIDGDAAAATASLIGAEGGSVVPVRGDVTTPEGVAVIIAAAREVGPIDILVNHAGSGNLDDVLATSDESWADILALNLTGPFLMSRAVLSQMVERSSGVIINTVSVCGIVGGRSGAAYTASKHGLVGLTRNIATAYGRRGVRCVGILPGTIRSDPALHDGPAIAARGESPFTDAQAMNHRPGQTDEIAEVVRFLASDAASYINGAMIPVDGGWSAF